MVEQEAYATYRTVMDFECFLIGRPFTLYTDSQNLTFLKESPSRKIQRWRLAPRWRTDLGQMARFSHYTYCIPLLLGAS